MSAARTPGPWISGKSYKAHHRDVSTLQGGTVATCDVDDGPYTFGSPSEINYANAAFIVRACNAHDALVAALHEAERLIPELVRQLPRGVPMSVAAAHDRIRAALREVQP